MDDKKTIIIFILSLTGAFLLGGIIGFFFHGCGLHNFYDMPQDRIHGRMMRNMNVTGMMMYQNINNQASANAIAPNDNLQESGVQDIQNPLQEITK